MHQNPKLTCGEYEASVLLAGGAWMVVSFGFLNRKYRIFKPYAEDKQRDTVPKGYRHVAVGNESSR